MWRGEEWVVVLIVFVVRYALVHKSAVEVLLLYWTHWKSGATRLYTVIHPNIMGGESCYGGVINRRNQMVAVKTGEVGAKCEEVI